MKNSIRRILAWLSAAVMLSAAVPTSHVFADGSTDNDITEENKELKPGEFGYEITDKGAVITGYTYDEVKSEGVITVPKELDGHKVVGISDFAFADVDCDVRFVVPDTLKLDCMGSEAFVTSYVFSRTFTDIPGCSSLNDIARYWINELSGADHTDEETADAVRRVMERIGDIPADDSIEKTAIAVIKEIRKGNCNFSQDNIDRLELTLSTLSYLGTTLEIISDVKENKLDIAAYARAKNDLEYTITAPPPEEDKDDRIYGDVSGNYVLDLNDAVLIAKYIVGSVKFTDRQMSIGDYNRNGVIDLNDVIGIAKAIL